jgi:adenylate cyclase
MQVGFRILHPLFDGTSIVWTAEGGVEVEYFAALDEDGSAFRLSPFYYMLTRELTELRLRLDRDAIVDRFPLLAQFRDRGLTDYLAMIVAFGDAPLTPEAHNGLGISRATRAAEGFSEGDVAIMRQVLAPLALALRVVIKDQITKNALNTFHGPLIGARILSGTIKRGAGERLKAALWYSDLRNSTGLADELSVDRFLDLLNTYFDCAAGGVMAQGGQVLDIIGDAILAFFPAEEAGGEAEACSRALDAAIEAHARLAALRAAGNQPARAIQFRVGVHFGDVVFGNAGTAERLKFGVIGRAVNEVARTVDLAKLLARPIVVSEEAAKRAARPFTDLGLHHLRGIPVPRRLWALELPAG